MNTETTEPTKLDSTIRDALLAERAELDAAMAQRDRDHGAIHEMIARLKDRLTTLQAGRPSSMHEFDYKRALHDLPRQIEEAQERLASAMREEAAFTETAVARQAEIDALVAGHREAVQAERAAVEAEADAQVADHREAAAEARDGGQAA